jgi:hypothetical protein
MTRLKTILFLTLLCVLPAFPWGAVGHATIAAIAEKNLSPETLEKIKPLLSGQTIEEAAIWAYQYKQTHRNTAPWHYIDLPVRQDVTAAAIPSYCAQDKHQGGDVVSQITKDIEALKAPGTGLQERRKAFWFLIHFMGDVHMPLHAADDNDAGGNDKKVRFFAPDSHSKKGHVTNLHSLWDNLIEVKAAEDPRELGEELSNKITPAERRAWASGSLETWVFESYSIAKNDIYPDIQPDNAVVTVLPRDYYDKMRPVVDEQLEKAGIRLAVILEEVFGK